MFKKRTKPLLVVSHRLSVLVHLWCKVSPSLWNYCYTCLIWVFCFVFGCEQNQLSGYLLRKFKTSNGWQKLWVVFTNFCLFFYKTYQVSNHRTANTNRALTCTVCRHQQDIDINRALTCTVCRHHQDIDINRALTCTMCRHQQYINNNKACTPTKCRHHQQSVDINRAYTPTKFGHRQSIHANRVWL